MRRLWGLPPHLMRLGQYTYRYHGQVDFQIVSHGRFSWYCHEGYQLPPSLRDRSFNRNWGLPANDRGMTAMHREDGWGSMSRKALLRKVARSVESGLKELMEEDARYLEAKGVRMGRV